MNHKENCKFEPQSGPAQELIRMLQIFPVRVTHKDHLLEEFAVGRRFRYDLPEDEEQLLDGVVLEGQHEAYNGHQEAGEAFAGEDYVDGFLEGLDFLFDVALF